MRKDVVNFNAGPAGLPDETLERAQAELLDFEGTGMSILEHSHREKAYESVHFEARSLVREVLSVPASHDVLFLQGGASSLFATVPMNFLSPGKSADYVMTGSWSRKALDEARIIGKARPAGSGEVGGKWTRIPAESELVLDPDAAYVHITTNNTIEGTQFSAYPDTRGVPLIADMSSDICSRPLDVARFGMLYAGAQKNLGPSGLVLAIIERGLLARGSTAIPTIFRFKTHADADSLYHTPPTFSVYLMRNVFLWIKAQGGLAAMERRNREKAEALYAAIDRSDGFYSSPVEESARSWMNVVFRLPGEALEKRFAEEATAAGLVGLRGHRSVGGMRASIYNAVSVEGVRRLTAFMAEFAKKARG